MNQSVDRFIEAEGWEYQTLLSALRSANWIKSIDGDFETLDIRNPQMRANATELVETLRSQNLVTGQMMDNPDGRLIASSDLLEKLGVNNKLARDL